MPEEGVSRSYVDSRIGALDSRVDALADQLRSLEAEMAAVAAAVQHMSELLGAKLEAILRAQGAANATLDSSLATQRQALSATVAGFATELDATLQVHGAVRRDTDAVVCTNLLRLEGEARAPISQAEAFSAEIEERFARALLGVMTNRQLFDHHFQDVLTRYDRKLRVIGEHIYRILDEDFTTTIESRVRIPHETYRELALEVDRRRIELRGERLERKLKSFDAGELAPLLDMHREFETEVAARYSTDLPADIGEFRVPVAIRVHVDGTADGVVATRCVADPGRLPSRGVGFRLEPDARFDDLRKGFQRRAADIAASGRTRRLLDAEVAELESALGELARKGLIAGEILPELTAYVRTHGIEVLEGPTAIVIRTTGTSPNGSPHAGPSVQRAVKP